MKESIENYGNQSNVDSNSFNKSFKKLNDQAQQAFIEKDFVQALNYL